MYLQKIELHGFKSFYRKVAIKLDTGITAIVGPNGSGKSNVVDALRWVLGEQSIKSLRGNRLEDVIFSGTKNKKQLGMAEVTIVLDNSSGMIPLEYNQISVTRKVFRDGESQFLINKNPCRLKDVQALFMDTGLGKNAFAIIGQGKVDDIINSTPEERRPLFEEVAGITKYKFRKKEAQQKLADTENSLLRIDDIILEIEAQLPELKIEAERAEKYLEKQKALDSMEYYNLSQEKDRILKRLNSIKLQSKKNTILSSGYAVFLSKMNNYLLDAKLIVDKYHDQISILANATGSINSKLEKKYGYEKLLKEKVRGLHREIEIIKEDQKQHSNDIKIWSKKIDDYNKEIEVVDGELYELKEKLQNTQGEIDTTESKIQENNLHIQDTNDTLVDFQAILTQYKGDSTKAETKISLIDKQKSKIEEQINNKKINLTKLQEEKKVLVTNLTKQKEDFSLLKNQYDEINSKLDSIKKTKQHLKSEIENIKGEYYKVKSRLSFVNDLERDLEGYFPGVKVLLNIKTKNPLDWEGLLGTVADILTVPTNLVLPVEVALGAQLQNIITKTSMDAEKAISFLKNNKAGKVTFLPMDTIQPKTIEIPSTFKNQDGFVGIGSELVKCDQQYERILNYLLGRVLIVSELKKGLSFAKHYNYSLKIVSLDGQIIMPGGSITGGYVKSSSTGILSRKNEIINLESKLLPMERKLNAKNKDYELQEELEKNLLNKLNDVIYKMEELKQEITKIENHLSNNKEKISTILDEVNILSSELKMLVEEKENLLSQIEVIEKNKQEIEAKILNLNEKSEEYNKNNFQLQNNLASIKEAFHKLKTQEQLLNQKREQIYLQMQELQDRRKSYQDKIEVSNQRLKTIDKEIIENKHKIIECNNEIAKLLRQKQTLEDVKDDLLEGRTYMLDKTAKNQKIFSTINAFNDEINKKQHLLDLEKTRLETSLDTISNTITERFPVNFIPIEINLKNIKEAIKETKHEIEALGQVNVGAIEHYQKSVQRISFLKNQKSDLIKAKNSLNKVIKEVDSIMEERFSQTFAKVGQEFSNIFTYLFGGGTASLFLTDEEDLLNTGIDIEAQPPGKKLQNLSLLSGGEKALTAISLLFAFLRIKPSPFCVLDEIEASLDEANEQRFSQFLRELSDKTQFLIVTHRQNTMLVADNLYGITTEEPGVSKVISVKIKDNLAV